MTAFLFTGIGALAQNQGEDYLGLPGDNLNLYAVMKLFQESRTLEEFERDLNDESSRINNLDLNGDNQIDYISVFDNVNGNVHTIVLQVAINERERQDVAVFTVGKDSEGNVWLQLTGDEALYGKNYIIEPILDNVAETPNPGYVGTATTVNGRRVVQTTTSVTSATPKVVMVTTWPIVTYIYSPAYVIWRSPWYWGYYPPYWSPWRPYYWHYYYGYHYHWYDRYYVSYHRTYYHRYDYWDRYYYRPHYTYSIVVINNIKSGYYKVTYSRPAERSRGEALYLSTYGNNNRRQESVSVAETNRRNTAATTTNNRSTVNNSSSAARRDATASTTRTETRPASSSASTTRSTDASTQRSATQANTSERRSVQSSTSNTRSSSSSASSSSTRASQPSTQARSSGNSSRSSESRAAVRTRSESSSSSSNNSNSRSNETRSTRR